MLTIICVYNNKKSYQNNLLKSLKRQNIVYELVAIDNTKNKFKSAASALNYGAKNARGKYLVFVHQDVVLRGDDWLSRAEKILNQISKLGVAGSAGLNLKNQRVGYINDRGKIWGKSFKKPQKAQTIDECLLIIPRNIFKKLEFDEQNFDHWHCYGVDYCLEVKKLGLSVYTIPLLIDHNSPSANLKNLFKYQRRVFQKHYQNNRYICTTCGFLSRSTIGLKTYFPNSRLVEFYWGEAGVSPIGDLRSNLVKRANRALKKRLKGLKE